MNIKKALVLGGLFFGALIGTTTFFAATADEANACPSACAPKRTIVCADGSTISGPDHYSTENLRSRCGGGIPETVVQKEQPKKKVTVQKTTKPFVASTTDITPKKAPPVKKTSIALKPPYCDVGSGFVTWSTSALEKFGMGTMCDSKFGGNNVKAIGNNSNMKPVRDDNGCVLRVVHNSKKQLASGSCARAVVSAYSAGGELYFVTRDGVHLKLTSKYRARKVRF